MVKKFDKHDLDLMNELVGKKFIDIFKQLEMFVINFGEGIEYSLHTYTFCRIKSMENVFLTSNDEYFSPKFKYLSEKKYNDDELHIKSLLNMTLKNVRKLLNNSIVTKVQVFDNGDINIEFDNNMVFETLIDRKSDNFEYYRFIKFIPNYQALRLHNVNSMGPHIIIGFKDGTISSELVE
jgi:hypothetical protein